MDKIIEFAKTSYLKRPVLLVLFVSILLTLPWITMSDFYTKGEPREATVATTILNTGNWILPTDYADEVAYKPPFMHWFIAAFSLPAGHVTETTARLPSALGLIGITVLFFVFLYKRKSKTVALIASMLLLTSFEMHRSGIEGRVDMFLAFFMIASLISLYKWEEKGLKGYPVFIPVLLASAALIKGPVGVVLPCLVFGIYLLLLQRYSLWKIIIKNSIVALPALAVLVVWYFLAYKQGGQQFYNVVYAENFGRFLGQDSKALGIAYDLGHKGPFWYYIPAILIGFFPWSFLLIFGLFVVSFKKIFKSNSFQISAVSQKLKQADTLFLYSLVAVVIILGFYAIPSSKRSVYIMPAYPFAAYLLALLYERAVAVKPQLIRSVAWVVFVFSGLVLLLTLVFHFVNLSALLSTVKLDERSLFDVNQFSVAFQQPGILAVILWLLLAAIFAGSIVIYKRKHTPTLLFASIALFVCLQVFLEGFAYPVFKNGHSMRPFAEKIASEYNLKGKTYVINNLRDYPNMYELNFYLGNDFKNFEKVLPTDGYFLIGAKDIDKIRAKYTGSYRFDELNRTENGFNDFRDVVVIYKIVRIGNIQVH